MPKAFASVSSKTSNLHLALAESAVTETLRYNKSLLTIFLSFVSMKNFSLIADLPFTRLFLERGVTDFHAACAYVQALPYGRNTTRGDFSQILTEGKGACSGKHALLASLAEEHGEMEIELIAGMFLLSGETHNYLAPFFEDKPYTAIPEFHCYLRYKGERFDYTGPGNPMERIAPKIVREQRIEPHQVVDWKPKIHAEYLQGWLRRNPQIDRTFEQLWEERETCITLMTQNDE
jgi:hypothetical protein